MHGQSPHDTAAHGSAKSDLTHVFRALTDRDAQVRQEAWKRLLETGVSHDELTPYLRHGQPRVREGATRFVPRARQLNRELAIDSLRDLVQDANSYVAAGALETLGKLKAIEARDDVLLSLDDSHPMVIRAAIIALGQIGPLEMGERLVPFLDAPATHLRLAAIDALAELRYRPAIPRLIELLQGHAGQIRGKSFEFSEPAQLIRALGMMRAEEAIPLLIDFVRREIGLRSRALKVLQQFDSPTATLALAAFLQELARYPASPDLTAHIIRHLVDVEFRFAADDVIPLLNCPYPDVRRAALKAVHHWRLTEACAAVRDLAHREASDLVRPEAVRTLGLLAGPDALTDFQHFAHDPNAWVRRAVGESLLAWPDPSPEARALLEDLRRDPGVATFLNVEEPMPSPPSDTFALPTILRPFAPALRLSLEAWRDSLEPSDALQPALSQVLSALNDRS